MDKVKKKESLNIPVMIFCIVGIVLTVLGFMLAKNNGFRLNVISTEASVSGFQTKTDSNGDIIYNELSLSYSANKSNYSAKLTVSNDKNYNIGDKIDLYYDFFEPGSVKTSRTGYQGYLCFIIGIIFVLKTGPRFFRIIRDNYL